MNRRWRFDRFLPILQICVQTLCRWPHLRSLITLNPATRSLRRPNFIMLNKSDDSPFTVARRLFNVAATYVDPTLPRAQFRSALMNVPDDFFGQWVSLWFDLIYFLLSLWVFSCVFWVVMIIFLVVYFGLFFDLIVFDESFILGIFYVGRFLFWRCFISDVFSIIVIWNLCVIFNLLWLDCFWLILWVTLFIYVEMSTALVRQ